MQLKSFYHFRIKKWILQLDRIRLAFLYFPIPFLSVPPQSRLNSLSSLISGFAPNISSSSLHLFVLLFFYAQAPPSTPTCFLPHVAFPYLPCPLCSPHLLLLLRDKAVPENIFLCQWEEVAGKGRLVVLEGICSSDSFTPACRCRGTQQHESVFPLRFEDLFWGVIVGGINSLRNICCHIILE